MLNTGILARVRLWRVLHKADKLKIAGQLEEARKLYDLAVRINPRSKSAIAALTQTAPLQRWLEFDSDIGALKARIAQILEHLTTLKALSIETVRRRSAFEALEARVELLSAAMNRHDHEIAALGSHIGRALEHLTTLRATNIELATRRTALSVLEQRVDADLNSIKQTLTAQAEEGLHQIGNLKRAVGSLDARIDKAAEIRDAEVAAAMDKLALRVVRLEQENHMGQEKLQSFEKSEENLKHWQSHLANRIEFVRREMMYEFHHGPRRDQMDYLNSKIAANIINLAKLEEQSQSGLRLNLGCGHITLDGYINIDRRELPNIDIVAEIDALPFEPQSISEIHSAHLLEHFPQEELIRRVLPYWVGLMRPGGVFSAVVPDGDAMMQNWAGGHYPFDDLREVIFGAQDYIGDYHYNIFTPDSLSKILEDQGFKDILIVEKGRQNGKCYEFEIKARLPPNMSGV